MSYDGDKVLAGQIPLFGVAERLGLPAGRAPGLDAHGRGVWDPRLAVAQPSEPGRTSHPLWDPYDGFEVRP